jgi:hypothetical protein
MLITTLTEFVRQEVPLSPGQVWEVQLNPVTGHLERDSAEVATVEDFIVQWGHSMGSVRLSDHDRDAKWLGLVHVDGAVLVRLEP